MGARLAGTTLERGRVIPGASLREARSGRELPVLGLRGRKALVLCVLHQGCDACERFGEALAEAEGDIAAADGRVLLLSPDARAVKRLLGPDGVIPTVIVTDRYAAGWEAYPAPDHDFPPVTEVVATLWHLATMCPECGVSTWE